MTTNDDQPCLRIERRFDVPPEAVFETLTDPDQKRPEHKGQPGQS